ncbi:hypothetical protein EVG20_g4622 [Dentipellis fragilis]|uniref:Uncharacterized protein n=1 Tax=Dentipellis fragilis TaxID=205917 RepID=A0A4Y9YVL0_9AGAM|nr:hypothetical protein EVG20_g4622 [Dentipellis fragilis]
MDNLPLELLIQVISFTSLDAFKGTPPVVHPHLVIPLSHVCRRWRNATLTVSPFWCIVYNWYSRDLVLACLTRSRALPLRIRVDLATVDVHQWFIDLLPTAMPRARSLCIRQLSRCEDPSAMMSKILPALQSPAPCLEEFTIDINVRNPICLPILFSGTTPTLYLLSLRSVLWSPGNIFKGLTHLELSAGSRAQCQRLIDVLRSNPLLETLMLSGAFPSTVAAERRIKLPRLRKLDIRDSPWAVVHQFLADIELPPSCQLVYITGSVAPESNDHVLTSVLPADLTYLHPFDRPTKLILGAPYTMSLCGSNVESCSTFEIFSSWVLDQQTFFEQSIASLIAISRRGSLMLEDVRELWLGPLGGSHIPREARRQPARRDVGAAARCHAAARDARHSPRVPFYRHSWRAIAR